ncbi:restriction endonuclease subunit S [Campylobacter upsaliensis]|nr:restriction endonuclease subunit S [Campylobacter upsaliensis]
MSQTQPSTHPLESLLQQHCPNGVEFKPLYELTFWDKKFAAVDKAWQPKTLKFTHILAKDLQNLIVPNGDIKLLSTGKFDDYTDIKTAQNLINEGEVLAIPSGGEANLKYYKGKFVDSGNILATARDSTNSLKFIYYYLLTRQKDLDSSFRGGSIKHPEMKKILQIPIPLPPLEIQHKIVEILDAFTELQAELEAELEARLKQYHYYRNKLLSHDELENRTAKSRNDSDPTPLVPYVTLGEACEILDNLRKPITKSKRTQGIYPYYGANGIQDYVNEYIFDGDFLLMGEDGSVINKDNSPVLNWVSGKFWVNNHAHILKEKSNTTNLRFVFFYLQTCDVSSIVRGVPPKINQQNLKTIQIPLPPLAVQNEIVELLDKFDTLTNDLTSGIPAEIEARKKQYEYYRERLLSFIAKD